MKIPLSLLKFCAGGASNLMCQAVRSVLNAASSLLFALSGTLLALLCILQFAGGGKAAGTTSATRAWRLVKSSLAAGATALLQAAAAITFVGPLLRGAQACCESMKPVGIYAPAGSGRNKVQAILGLNSWEPEKSQEEKAKKGLKETEISKEVSPPKPRDKDWDAIVANYLGAKDSKETDAARRRMALAYPMRYIKALRAAQDARRPRSRA